MTYYHLSQEERYQITALLIAELTQAQISVNLDRHKSAICREISRNSGLCGYRPGQACRLAENRTLNCRNARLIAYTDCLRVEGHLKDQLSPEQITSKVWMSYESIYRDVCAGKAIGGDLYKSLGCQRKRRKRYAGGRDRRGKFLAEDRCASVQGILKRVGRSDTGRAIR